MSAPSGAYCSKSGGDCMAHYLTPEEREERVRQLTDKLESGISDVFQSDHYADYLRTMSKFHQYSFRNTILIFLQFPDASQVAGYNDWKKKFDRQVKAGEHGISILAPCTSKKQVQMIDPDTQLPVFDANGQPVMEQEKVTRYRVVTVFDVSQTEGKELPEPCVAELTGDVAEFERITAALQALSPLPVSFEDFSGDAYGYCDHAEGRIVIRPGLSQKQTLKTLVHEIAHAKLHPPADILDTARPKRSTRELEAESVAYVVCQHFGIDTSGYSFGYVADWTRDKDMKQLKASLDLIRSTSAELIAGMEGHEQEQARTAPQRRPRRPRKSKRKTAPVR